jgi:hypothetical protein
MLIWNQYEFIECLEVLPAVDEEYETNHVFRVEKDGLILILTIYQYSGDVYFDLKRDGIEEPVFRMRLIDCPGARYLSTKDGKEYLEFAPSKSFGGRYDGESPIPMGVRIAVNPHIQIELF